MQVNSPDVQPFNELPEALVEELLDQCGSMGETLSHSFRNLLDNKGSIRNDLVENGLPRHDSICSQINHIQQPVASMVRYAGRLPTDMVAVAGVAAEGLTPKRDQALNTPIILRVLPARHHDKTALSQRRSCL